MAMVLLGKCVVKALGRVERRRRDMALLCLL